MKHNINQKIIESDFPSKVIEKRELPKDIVQRLEDELQRFYGACHYDHDIKKIVYHSLLLAEKMYDLMQLYEMKEYICRKHGDHPTIEQENHTGIEWILQHREGFRNLWVKTHKLVSEDR
jgi:hypothetical protein